MPVNIISFVLTTASLNMTGAFGAIVSMVTPIAADATLILPAASVAVTIQA